jgi:hypothetical protein
LKLSINNIELRYIIALVIIWIAVIWIVNPIADIPLNDDWAYSIVTRTLLTEGQFHYTGWESMTLIAQALWGAIFCSFFGMSFNSLRFSMLVLGLIGILATYGLLRLAKMSVAKAFWSTLLVAFNPLFFYLSFTFMTDIPFFTFSMLSLFVSAIGLEKNKRTFMIVGQFFGLAAIFTRQIGIILPAAFGIAFIAKYGVTPKNLIKSMVPFSISFGLLRLYEYIVESMIGLPLRYGGKEQLKAVLSIPIPEMMDRFFNNTLILFVYLGLFLLPFVAVIILNLKQFASHSIWKWSVSISAIVTIIILSKLVMMGNHMPLTGNILYNTGLGTPTLKDIYILGINNLPQAPRLLWIIVTYSGVVGGCMVLTLLTGGIIASLRENNIYDSLKNGWLSLFILATAAGYYLAIMIAGGFTGFFDRYSVFMIPLILVLIAPLDQHRMLKINFSSAIIGGILLSVMVFFSITGMHDYLAWNRARWQALTDLTITQNVSPYKIDGGFEFNGLYLFDIRYQRKPGKSWWWVHDDEYIVTFGEVPDYEVYRQYPYNSWLFFRKNSIFVLKRNNI